MSTAQALPVPLPSGLSVVVPVYNSEASLPLLLERLAAVLPTVRTPFEVILVNDGSRDGSWAVVQALAQRYPFVLGLDLMRNYGQHNALLCGVRLARFDTVATLDDDLQNPPEELPRLLAALTEGTDVVYGPPAREQHGLLRDLASAITKITLRKGMGAESARNISAFRVFRTRLRDAFSTFCSPFVSLDVLLTWGTSRFAVVRVRHDPRNLGASNYTFGMLVLHALNMLTGFSTLPLRIASVVGLGVILFGVATLVYIVTSYLLRGTPVQGFPFLASIVTIFSGAQLFSLGIMGEYLARLHFRMMDRPPYALRAVCRAPEAP